MACTPLATSPRVGNEGQLHLRHIIISQRCGKPIQPLRVQMPISASKPRTRTTTCVVWSVSDLNLPTEKSWLYPMVPSKPITHIRSRLPPLKVQEWLARPRSIALCSADLSRTHNRRNNNIIGTFKLKWLKTQLTRCLTNWQCLIRVRAPCPCPLAPTTPTPNHWSFQTSSTPRP